MIEKHKIKNVNSPDELLKDFIQVIAHQSLPHFVLRANATPVNRVELTVTHNDLKDRFVIYPKLNPSRKLLNIHAEASGKRILLLCPHIPEALAAELQLAGINFADLNGRLFIQSPSFLIDRQPHQKVYGNAIAQITPFTARSSRLVRALLSHPAQPWTQAEFTIRTSISRTLVSLTLAELIQQELVEQTRSGSRHLEAQYRVKNFDALLDAWKAEDRWSKRAYVQQYSVLTDNLVALAEKARHELGADNLLFTQWFAAHLRNPYTTPPLVSAYVKQRPVHDLPWARPVDNGGNLWLITAKDEGVFQETQTVNGFSLACDVQIYLDLLSVGQRGPEQAQALREWEGFGK